MKLALIRRRFSATGGAELYLQRLLAALGDAGHEVHLFAETWDDPPKGTALHVIPTAGTRAQRPWNFAHAVDADLKREMFDCVFSLERTLRQDVYRAGDGVHCVWLKRRRQFAPWWRKPFVGAGAFHRTMLSLETQTFDPGHTRHIIANSEMVKAEIRQHFAFPSERVHVIRNGVDVKRFQSGQREATRARFGIQAHEFLLLFVGSGWERKGLKYVVRALHGLSTAKAAGNLTAGARLLVAGKGRFPGSSENVIFAGPMSNVEDAYAAADLFVFLPIYEPSANVVFEALASGLPVVTTRHNGAAEMIQERVNGSIIEDPNDTAAAMDAIRFWQSRRLVAPPIDVPALSLDRNIRDTLAVLELAAAERMP